MEDFLKYLTKTIKPDEVEIWAKMNNIIPEKLELFSDFCVSLGMLIEATYLGGDLGSNETKIRMTEEDDKRHFIWCWNKNLENFKEEGIHFDDDGEHFDYMKSFFDQTFYGEKKNEMTIPVKEFFNKVFNLKAPLTKSDLDMILELYTIMEKRMSFDHLNVG
jgi:hypothetical protein